MNAPRLRMPHLLVALLLAGTSSPAPAQGATVAAPDRQRLLELFTSVQVPAAGVVAEARAAQRHALSSGDVGLQSLALSVECRGLFRQTDTAGADRACAEARRLAAAGDELAMFAAGRMAGALIVERGQPLAALATLVDAHAAATRSGEPLAIAAALGSLGAAAQFAGANTDAVDYYSRAIPLATRVGAHGLHSQLANNLGVLLLEAGDPAGARRQFEQAIAAAGRLPGGHDPISARYGLALAQIDGEQADEAAATLRTLLAARDPRETPIQRAEGQLFLARAEFRLGRHREAETAARAAVDGLRAARPVRAYPAQALLVDVLAAAGRLDEAGRLGDRLLREIPEEARGRVELLEARERVYAARDDFPDAYRMASEARRVRAQQSLARATHTLEFMRVRAEAEARAWELAELRDAQARVIDAVRQERRVRNLSLALLAVTLAGGLALWRTARTRRRLETEVERRRGIDALGTLTAGVAHDFNNLMTIVQQAMGLLRRDPVVMTSGPALELIADAESAARIGGSITQQLLAFASKQPMRPEIVLPVEHLEARRALFERTLGESMRLTLQGLDATCRIRVDPDQLTAALINLLTNARDAMAGRGEVTIRLGSVRHDPRDGGWPELGEGPYVTLSVIDTGRGMSAEVASQAAMPFYTTKESDGGTGLGLSSVLGFARQSQGSLEVDSLPGVGTRVTLVLPRV